MAIREVVIFPDERLRGSNSPVTVFDDSLKALAADMFETMYHDEGVGLAAPQIGLNIRLVVIDIPDEDGSQGRHQLVLANPRITSREGELVESEEGCLSVPDYRDKVKRYERCSVEYQDLEGRPQKIEHAEGLLAVCLQHETDHLDGKLFIDYLSRLKREILKKKYRKQLKERLRAQQQ